MRKGSSKPCPGCNEVVEYRRADKLCYDCQKAIENGRRYEKEQKKDRPEVISICDNLGHQFPYIPHSDKNRSRFQETFLKLVHLVGADTGNFANAERLLPSDSYYGKPVYLRLHKGGTDVLREIYRATQDIAEEAYQEGLEDGRNFIIGLAKGDVSIQEFNKATIEKRNGKRQ